MTKRTQFRVTWPNDTRDEYFQDRTYPTVQAAFKAIEGMRSVWQTLSLCEESAGAPDALWKT